MKMAVIQHRISTFAGKLYFSKKEVQELHASKGMYCIEFALGSLSIVEIFYWSYQQTLSFLSKMIKLMWIALFITMTKIHYSNKIFTQSEFQHASCQLLLCITKEFPKTMKENISKCVQSYESPTTIDVYNIT